MKISYVITLQWRAGNGTQAATYTGTADVPQGSSRSALTGEIEAVARKDMGVPGDAITAILFLSIERDEL